MPFHNFRLLGKQIRALRWTAACGSGLSSFGEVVKGERWSKTSDAREGEGDSVLLCWTLMDAAVFTAMQGRYAETFPYNLRFTAMAERLKDPETTVLAPKSGFNPLSGSFIPCPT